MPYSDKVNPCSFCLFMQAYEAVAEALKLMPQDCLLVRQQLVHCLTQQLASISEEQAMGSCASIAPEQVRVCGQLAACPHGATLWLEPKSSLLADAVHE